MDKSGDIIACHPATKHISSRRIRRIRKTKPTNIRLNQKNIAATLTDLLFLQIPYLYRIAPIRTLIMRNGESACEHKASTADANSVKSRVFRGSSYVFAETAGDVFA